MVSKPDQMVMLLGEIWNYPMTEKSQSGSSGDCSNYAVLHFRTVSRKLLADHITKGSEI